MTGRRRSTGDARPRCGDLAVRDQLPVAAVDLTRLAMLPLDADTVPVPPMVVARLLAERERLVMVANATAMLVEAVSAAGLLRDPPDLVEPTAVEKAHAVARRAVDLYDAHRLDADADIED